MTQLATDAKVIDGMLTFFGLRSLRQRKRADVQELTATAYFAPTRSLNSSSNLSTRAPWVRCPDLRQEATASISLLVQSRL
jgi:hypothetical protein